MSKADKGTPVTVVVGTVIDPDMVDEMRVTVVATGLGETASAVAPQPEVEIKPVRLVSNYAAEGENVDYNSQDKTENPRTRRKTAKDFVKAAEADGFEYAERLSEPDDLDRVVREWLEFPGPAFLEVIIDRDAGVYPMVAPGKAYDQMITGDWIKSREKPAHDTLDPSEMF